jgi:hypothetical protein
MAINLGSSIPQIADDGSFGSYGIDWGMSGSGDWGGGGGGFDGGGGSYDLGGYEGNTEVRGGGFAEGPGLRQPGASSEYRLGDSPSADAARLPNVDVRPFTDRASDWIDRNITLEKVGPVALDVLSTMNPVAALANVGYKAYDAYANDKSYIPAISAGLGLAGLPAAQLGVNAYNLYDQGNTVGAGLTGLGALGIATGNPELGRYAGQIGSGLNAYNAANRGDYLTAGLSATGAIDPSLIRETSALNTINQGLQRGDLTTVLAGATALTQSSDLAYVTKGSRILDAVNSGDFADVYNLASTTGGLMGAGGTGQRDSVSGEAGRTTAGYDFIDRFAGGFNPSGVNDIFGDRSPSAPGMQD